MIYLKSIILINCGGVENISREEIKKEIKVYLFDNRRPFDHNNMNAKDFIYIVDDGFINLENCPTNEEYEKAWES